MAKAKPTKAAEAVETQEENPIKDKKKLAAEIDKSTGALLERIETEIKTGYRITQYEGEDYRICLPSMKDDQELSIHKNRLAAKYLRDDSLMTQGEVLTMMEKRGTWDKSKAKEEDRLRKRLGDCLSDIYLERAKDEPDDARLDELHHERLSVELDISTVVKGKEFFLNSTMESKIEEEVLRMKLALCLRDAKGERVFKDLEDLENSDKKGLINTVSTEAIYFWAGLDQSMFGYASG